MPSEHEQLVVRRFGIAVVVGFSIATALPFGLATAMSDKGSRTSRGADRSGVVPAESPQVTAITPVRGGP
jgi:hypothetical protein